MYNFKQYLKAAEDVILTESLNNPVEYYMTDDTKMPDSIFAAFDIDGNKYIMSLVRSDDAGVYLFEVGRTTPKGGKTLWWRFHNNSDIVQVLATSLNFIQASTAWMGDKIKGVAIQFKSGAALNAERAQRITEKIARRAYVKSFNVIPVSQPPLDDQDKHYYQKMRYVFIGKKGVSASTLFSGKTFKKYNIENGTAPIEAIKDLQPKKNKKATQTVKPSTKYSFSKFDVDTPVDNQLLNKLTNVKPVNVPEQDVKVKHEYNMLLNDATSSTPGLVSALPSLQYLVKALQKNGFDPNKFDRKNLDFILDSKTTEAEKKLLSQAKLMPSDSPTNEIWKVILQAVAGYNQSIVDGSLGAASTSYQAAKQFLQKFPKGQSPFNDNQQAIKSNINPNDLQATLPGSGTNAQPNPLTGGWDVDGNNLASQLDYLFTDLGYDQKLQKTSGFSQLVSYSGSSYSKYNTPMRKVVSQLLQGQQIDKQLANRLVKTTSSISKLARMFDKIDPLPESVWVYRGAMIPQQIKEQIVPGYQYVDPAFLSTSIRPNVSFGTDRMRIFVPKGSKVLPVLYHSHHSSEREILLPPSSVIKVVEVQPTPSRLYFQGVLMGSAWPSISTAIKKQLTESKNYDMYNVIMENITMLENKNNDKYDPEEKFGGEYDAELADLINREIEKGNFEIDKPEQSDD
jgi:hypothetical protein